jgi:head-tail adaptor
MEPMSLLSDSDVESMRATMAESFPDTAVIKTPQVVGDSGGGGTTSWTAAGTVGCRIAAFGSGAERNIADRLAEEAEWIVSLPAETAITTSDRVTINNTDFNVIAMSAPRSWELSRRVEVSEVV